MRQIARFAAVSCLALAIAACGPAEEPAEDPAADAGAVTDVAPAAEPTPDATETPADEASPTPTASESATVAAAQEVAAVATAAAPAAPATPPAAFNQCRVCHAVAPGQNGIGPSLAGIHGNRAGQVAGFSYTDGMKNSGLVWNDANLDRYLADPQGVVPGTMMAIGPLDAAQRRAIIAYLKTL